MANFCDELEAQITVNDEQAFEGPRYGLEIMTIDEVRHLDPFRLVSCFIKWKMVTKLYIWSE